MWRAMNTVTAAAMINSPVAVLDRIDRRAIPQTPWPLVQPPPKRVPKPTYRPAIYAAA